MAEATDSGESAPPLIPTVPSVRSHVELTQHLRSPHSSQQVKTEVTPDRIIMIQEHGDGVLLPDCCSVPTTLRHLKEEAYTPKVVSIGPFHHGNERLEDMERHKQKMFKRFTQRAGLTRDDLVHFVQPLVSKVRASYPETIDLTDTSKLVDMILLDAGFIIELFMCHERKDVNDAKLSQPWLVDSIVHDLLLLENQLPFFVIEGLFKRAFPTYRHGSRTSFLELTNEYFPYFSKQKADPNLDVKIKHFTDLLRLSYLQGCMPERVSYLQGSMPERRPTPEGGCYILLYNANALRDAGVKLRNNWKSKFILDLKFSGHVLEIPKFVVDDNTEFLFRNMIALEQCHYPHRAYITDYAFLLHCLIETNKDVDLLIRRNIVRNYLGDTNKVSSLINGLLDNVIQSTFNYEFARICESLNDYCERPHIPWRTWRTVASFAGTILLVLTIIQTIFSVLQVVLK